MKTTFFDTYSTGWQYSSTADVTAPTESQQTFKEILATTWQRLLAFITNPGDEPRIWTTHTADDSICWHAYDPLTGRRLCTADEHDILVWLEQRYNYQ
jgi:hypothetical protein